MDEENVDFLLECGEDEYLENDCNDCVEDGCIEDTYVESKYVATYIENDEDEEDEFGERIISVPIRYYNIFLRALTRAAKTKVKVPSELLEFFANVYSFAASCETKELGALCLRQRFFSLLQLIKDCEEAQSKEVQYLELTTNTCISFIETAETSK